MAGTYTISRGDTLSALALKHGISTKQLLALNPNIVDPNKIYPGQALNIPSPPATAPVSPPVTATPAPAPPAQTTRDKVIHQLYANEDFRSNAYPDPIHGSKVPTTGYGTTRESPGALAYLKSQGLDPSKVFVIGSGGQAITKDQALDMVNLALDYNRKELVKLYPNFDKFPEPARIGLQDMSYQMSPFTVGKFPNMSNALRADKVDWDLVAREGMDSKWARTDTPARAKRVTDQIASSKTWKPPVPLPASAPKVPLPTTP